MVSGLSRAFVVTYPKSMIRSTQGLAPIALVPEKTRESSLRIKAVAPRLALSSLSRSVIWGCALVAIALSACATVAPYERENLARADMQFLGSPEIAESELHATVVREGSIGGFGGGGGGCGCN